MIYYFEDLSGVNKKAEFIVIFQSNNQYQVDDRFQAIAARMKSENALFSNFTNIFKCLPRKKKVFFLEKELVGF